MVRLKKKKFDVNELRRKEENKRPGGSGGTYNSWIDNLR